MYTDVTEYLWDHRNRLVGENHYVDYVHYQSLTTDYRLSFTYDYLGRKIREGYDADGSAGSGTMTYDYLVYQGSMPLLQYGNGKGVRTIIDTCILTTISASGIAKCSAATVRLRAGLIISTMSTRVTMLPWKSTT